MLTPKISSRFWAAFSAAAVGGSLLASSVAAAPGVYIKSDLSTPGLGCT
jgi:hypothetical protein